MPAEQYANNATTTLSGDITSGATVIAVASNGTSPWFFPGVPQFRIRVDDELLLVTSLDNLIWTVTRSIESSVAASHASGAVVRQLLTLGGLSGVGTKTTTATGYLQRPSSGNVGQLFFPTDGCFIEREAADHTFDPWGPAFSFVAPINEQFVWINQGTATVVTSGGGIHIHAPGHGAGANARIRKKAAPATPYVVTAYVEPALFFKDFHVFGLVFRQSSDGKLVTLDQLANGGVRQIRITQWNSPTAAITAVQPITLFHLFRWLRIGDDGTNRNYYVSPDGIIWTLFYSETRTTFITADEIGFFVMAENSAVPNLDVSMMLLSWKES